MGLVTRLGGSLFNSCLEVLDTVKASPHGRQYFLKNHEGSAHKVNELLLADVGILNNLTELSVFFGLRRVSVVQLAIDF
jgi:hypothetical protein